MFILILKFIPLHRDNFDFLLQIYQIFGSIGVDGMEMA